MTKCYYHQNEQLSNFCTCTGCSLPLCPSCIKTHLLEHRQEGHPAAIQTLANCFQIAEQDLTESIHAVEQVLERNSQQIENDLLEELRNARQSVLEQIHKRFDNLQTQLKQAIHEGTSRHSTRHSYFLLRNHLTQSFNNLNSLHQQIIKRSVKSLVRYHTANLNSKAYHQIHTFKEEVEHLPKVIINSACISELLRRAITIETQRFERNEKSPAELRTVGQEFRSPRRRDEVGAGRIDQIKYRLHTIRQENHRLSS